MSLLELAKRSALLREVAILVWRKGWLKPPQNTVVAELGDGRRLECELSDRTQRRMYLDSFEPGETEAVRAIVEPGDVVVDVGAHIGWFTTLCGIASGSDGRVYAFEAYPKNSAQLDRNVELNHLSNVTAIRAGASDMSGLMEIGPQVGSDSGSITLLGRERRDIVMIPLVTVDSVLAQEPSRIRLLKIDVEGYEVHVLRGASATLERTDAVLIEVNKNALETAGTSEIELREKLASVGLNLWTAIREEGIRKLRRRRPITNYLVTRM